MKGNPIKPNKRDFPFSSKFPLWTAIVIARPRHQKRVVTPVPKRHIFRLLFGSYPVRMLTTTPTTLTGVIFSLPHCNV